MGISHSAKPFNLLGGHEPAPYALFSMSSLRATER
jgi:hypothetical protein